MLLASVMAIVYITYRISFTLNLTTPYAIFASVLLLEGYCLLDAGFRSITAFGNNIANPTWGELGTDLLRVSPVASADGIIAPSTESRSRF
jgi:hypothetical protein